jgi:hypothetical protein
MEKEFVPYELALRMKQFGFDEECFGYYMNGVLQPSLNPKDYSYFDEMSEINPNIKNFENVLAPLFQQAFRWFREIKEVEYQITYAGAKGRYNAFVEDYFYGNNGDLKEFTYEEAELACLEKLIEIVEHIKP